MGKKLTPEHREKVIKTLRRFDQMTPEEHHAASSLGGKNSVEAKKRQRTFKEAMQWALDLPAESIPGNELVDKIVQAYPGLTIRDAMSISMAKEAIINGNAKAYEVARDTTGELPVQTVNVKNEAPIEINIRTVD